MFPTMLSRSGRTSPDGKLHLRLDIPVSEDLHDLTVIAAAKRNIPKAEFVRELLTQALAEGYWLPLSDEASSALDVLCALRQAPRSECLTTAVEQALLVELDMLRSIARDHADRQSDECRKGVRE